MRSLLAVFLLAPAVAMAGTFHARWNFTDFVQGNLGVRQVFITTIAPYGVSGTNIITHDRRPYQSSGASFLVVSNMVNGRSYRVEFVGPQTTTTITNSFDTNVTGYVVVDGTYFAAPINDGSTLGYSQVAADARFIRGVAPGSNVTTSTNASGVVTVNATGSATGGVSVAESPSIVTTTNGSLVTPALSTAASNHIANVATNAANAATNGLGSAAFAASGSFISSASGGSGTNTQIRAHASTGVALTIPYVDAANTNRSFQILREATLFDPSASKDEITMLGNNVALGGQRANTNDTAIWLQMEHGFQQSAADGYDEIFASHIRTDGTGYRPWMLRLNRTNADDVIELHRNLSYWYDPRTGSNFAQFSPAALDLFFSGQGYASGLEITASSGSVQFAKYGPAVSSFNLTGAWSSFGFGNFTLQPDGAIDITTGFHVLNDGTFTAPGGTLSGALNSRNALYIQSSAGTNKAAWFNDGGTAVMQSYDTSSDTWWDVIRFSTNSDHQALFSALTNHFTGDLGIATGKGLTLGGVYRTNWPSGGGNPSTNQVTYVTAGNNALTVHGTNADFYIDEAGDVHISNAWINNFIATNAHLNLVTSTNLPATGLKGQGGSANTNGTAGQQLTSDGAGGMYWDAAGSGSGATNIYRLEFPTNAGTWGTFLDMPMDGNATPGTNFSWDITLGLTNPIVRFAGNHSSSGNSTNLHVEFLGRADFSNGLNGTLTGNASTASEAAHATNADNSAWSTNIAATGVVGAVAQATHATNADNATWSTNIAAAGIVGAVAEATHATNADNANWATNMTINDSYTIPMGAWFTNNVTSPADALSYSNICDSFAFADSATNEARFRGSMPLGWNAGTVRVGIWATCTGTNDATATNAVFAVSAAALNSGSDPTAATFGTAVWVTNKISMSANVSRRAITADLTVGNSPTANSSILWKLQRLGGQAGDTLTNTSLRVTEVQIFYTKTAAPAIPAAD